MLIHGILRYDFWFVKPYVDAHTLGLASMVALLNESGYKAHVSPLNISKAVEDVDDPKNFLIKNWILETNIGYLGFVIDWIQMMLYMFSKLISLIDNDIELNVDRIKITFAGLPRACDLVKVKYGKRFDVLLVMSHLILLDFRYSKS